MDEASQNQSPDKEFCGKTLPFKIFSQVTHGHFHGHFGRRNGVEIMVYNF